MGATRNRSAVTAAPRFPAGRTPAAVDVYLKRRPRLYNPCWGLLAPASGPPGTYAWNGEWYLLDQALFSRGLLSGSGIRYVEGSLRIFSERTVPGRSDGTVSVLTGGGSPREYDPKRRTGVSDHLPLVCQLDLPD